MTAARRLSDLSVPASCRRLAVAVLLGHLGDLLLGRKGIGCRFGQGFRFAVPRPAEQITAMLTTDALAGMRDEPGDEHSDDHEDADEQAAAAG